MLEARLVHLGEEPWPAATRDALRAVLPPAPADVATWNRLHAAVGEAFAAAAATADWTSVQDFNLVITNAPGEQAWPITATNFILMQKQPADPARNQAALAFFDWALNNGMDQASALHYVPLPADLVEQVDAYWASELGYGTAD